MAGRRRHWQLEVLRGWAVIFMIHYHYVWDLSFFGLYSGDLTSPGWLVWTRAWQVVFVGLVGVSVAMAGGRREGPERDKTWYRRGTRLLGLALAISVVTRIVLGDAFILFGILHLVGVTMLLAPWLWRGRQFVPYVGAGLVLVSPVLKYISTDTWWFVPFGVAPADYPAVDYFPLLPWLGIVMIGIGVGVRLQRTMSGFASTDPPKFFQPIAFFGRHSLPIYILHQPVLLAGFWMFGFTMW